ncbi:MULTISPECIES: glycosyltransferase [unclassified Paraflavitalea]|jgi:glycosyltransferase involved in cell wall biosynthesis|uniref:glycosyltransferase n=1 Tax=unclassified Paraflavitalea TaxID=2798305 RepID=UPI003D340588
MSTRIVFTVTNDCNFDQRMIRIAGTLQKAGFEVLLIGRSFANSPALLPQPFRQKRITCRIRTGKWAYFEFNLKLFFVLLFTKVDIIGAIDLDTILPCYVASALKGTKRVYDAHELFCEMKEVVSRPSIYAIWKRIERFSVPKFKKGYTVNQYIARSFHEMYGSNYEVIRNLPVLKEDQMPSPSPEPFLLYQGAVNEGRCFETLIPAMKEVNMPLHIYGDGNYLEQAKALVIKEGLEHKVIFKGKRLPEELRIITPTAYAGITLFDKDSKSNYWSLANRFFDYIHAEIPQLCVDYPVYREINNSSNIAVLIGNPDKESIAAALNELIQNTELYRSLKSATIEAKQQYNWQEEEKRLVQFYQTL